MLRLPERNWPVGEALHLRMSVERALDHDLAAVNAWPWSHLDDVVGRADSVLIVLDYNHGVPDIAQAFERGDHFHIVFGMQADAGFIQHIEHAHQARADLGGEADALRFAAGQACPNAG